MGNRKAREFKLKQELIEAWHHARTSEREITDDVHVPGIGGLLIQVVYSPSFEPGCSWEVRRSCDDLRLFRSEIVQGLQSRKLVGYTEMKADEAVLRGFFERLRRIAVPIEPDYSGCGGLDGTHFELALFGDLSTAVRFQWWSDSPAQWSELVALTQEMIDVFSKLEPFFETAAGASRFMG